MTKKEAAEVISRLFYDSTDENYPFCEEFGTACMIAIQELEKRKNDDLISRKTLIEFINSVQFMAEYENLKTIVIGWIHQQPRQR